MKLPILFQSRVWGHGPRYNEFTFKDVPYSIKPFSNTVFDLYANDESIGGCRRGTMEHKWQIQSRDFVVAETCVEKCFGRSTKATVYDSSNRRLAASYKQNKILGPVVKGAYRNELTTLHCAIFVFATIVNWEV
jgi:hypothetical protein